MCLFQINPSFDKKECVLHMVKCTKKHVASYDSFEACAEYWEPLVPLSSDLNHIRDFSH